MNQPAVDLREGALPPARMSLVVMLIFGSIASLLGLVAHGDNILDIDVRLLEAAQDVSGSLLDSMVTLSNAAFDTVGALAFGVIYAVIALLLRRPFFVLQLVVVIALRLVGQVWKPLFDSPRPTVEYQPDPSIVSSTMGYPSGHAYTASIIAVMVILLVLSLDVARWVKWTVMCLAILVAVLAMFSRVAIGAHWPTDTVGGVLYGIATVALMQLVVGGMHWLWRRRPGAANSDTAENVAT